MQKKAEDSLSDLRKKETEETHGFEMIQQNLENEIKNAQDKLDDSTKGKAEGEEQLAQAQSEMVETKKTMAADEEYSATLKTECEEAAAGWAERQKSAAAEMAAIDKAKEILVSGVTALLQAGARTTRWEDAEDKQEATRAKLTSFLQGLARKH